MLTSNKRTYIYNMRFYSIICFMKFLYLYLLILSCIYK